MNKTVIYYGRKVLDVVEVDQYFWHRFTYKNWQNTIDICVVSMHTLHWKCTDSSSYNSTPNYLHAVNNISRFIVHIMPMFFLF